MIKTKFSFLWISLAILLGISYGCSDDSDGLTSVSSNSHPVLEKVKRWSQRDDVAIDGIVWSESKFLKVPTQGSYTVSLPAGKTIHTLKRIVVDVAGDVVRGKYFYFYFADESDLHSAENIDIHQILENFTGTVNIIDLETGRSQSYAYWNGVSSSVALQARSGGSSACSACHNGWLDEVVIIGGGGGGGGFGDDPTPSGPQLPGGGFGGGGGSGVNPNDTPYDDDYPDCESFNFKKITSSTGLPYQEAAVKNINFDIIHIESFQPLRYNHYNIRIPQAVSFQMPTNLVVGNTEITPGMAASSAANAVATAMNQTINYFKTNIGTEMGMQQYFQTALKNAFELGNPGARLQMNPTSTVTPTTYKKNWFGPGDCN